MPSGKREKTFEERYRNTWRIRGLPEWRIEERWREYCKKEEKRGK